MKDTELRGVVLQKFYEMRHSADSMGFPDMSDISGVTETQIFNICEQLSDHGLIKWKPLHALGGIVAGMGKISAFGVDVIEGDEKPPIAMIFHDHSVHDHSVSISGSTNVQIGNSNAQDLNLDIGKLIAAVDHSTASDTEKAEAKSLLSKIAGNSLVQGALLSLFTGGAAS